jgi:Arc/MetJ-type ribon-helix-helix transcriptional regulator
MSDALPPDVHDQIRQYVATGHYASEDEAFRAAMRALAFHDEEVAAVQEGVSDMVAGRLRPFEEVDVEIRERFGFPRE